MRLDMFLVNNDYYRSRSQAKEAIEKGLVFVDGKCIKKVAYEVTDEEVTALELLEYVSRGGLKLKEAIKQFGLDFKDKTVVDIGASTGGFTDCALKNGAKRVIAIELGINQLDESLKNDPRVLSYEQTDFLDIMNLNETIDYYISDVSFTSIKPIIKHIKELDGNNIVALIKPQFEVEFKYLNKNGVLKDHSLHLKILEGIINYVSEIGMKVNKLIPSPIKGKSGNIEYLVYITKESKALIDYYSVVNKAFKG